VATPPSATATAVAAEGSAEGGVRGREGGDSREESAAFLLNWACRLGECGSSRSAIDVHRVVCGIFFCLFITRELYAVEVAKPDI